MLNRCEPGAMKHLPTLDAVAYHAALESSEAIAHQIMRALIRARQAAEARGWRPAPGYL